MADQNREMRGELLAGSRAWLRFATDDRLVASVRRRKDAAAFEILYDRHSGELLSFCRYMLGSTHDAEDAVQSTFASAYRALLADERRVALRPWLFAIARNECLSIMRRCLPAGELAGVPAPGEDPLTRVEQREDLRHMLASLFALPERQRAALVLSELHGFSHSEIGALLGARTDQVKSYVYQARASLVSDRQAHGADCARIREELSTARGAALLKSHLRRHLHVCSGCRDYAEELSLRRRLLGSLLPVAPSIALKHRAITAALGRTRDASTYLGGTSVGTSVAGTTFELAGGAVKTLVVKVLTGVACLAAGTSAGTLLVTGVATTQPLHAAPSLSPASLQRLRLTAHVEPASTAGRAERISAQASRQPANGRSTSLSDRPATVSGAVLQQSAHSSQSSAWADGGGPAKGNAGNPPGKSNIPGNGNAGNPPGKSNTPGNGNAGNPPGKSNTPGNGNAGNPPGKSNTPGNGNAGM